MKEIFTNSELIKIALKSPITYALIVLSIVMTYFISAFNNRSDDNLNACNAQIEYLRIRVDKLEKQVDEYTRVVLYKDAQIKSRDVVIDSLAKGGI